MRDGVSTFQAQTWMGWRSVVWVGAGRQVSWKSARILLVRLGPAGSQEESMDARMWAGSRQAATQSFVNSSCSPVPAQLDWWARAWAG